MTAMLADEQKTGRAKVNMSENQIGRAHVKDTAELRAYYSELEKMEAGALWTVANRLEPWHPTASSVPVIWRWEQLRPYLVRSADLVSAEESGRRVVTLLNPKRRDVTATCGWLFCGLQVVKPGERTSAHKHAASAFRFVMEGSGGYTVVDGELLHVKPRDFLLTPTGAWHDHGNSSDSELLIWQDGLDICFVNAMEANYYAIHPNITQAVASIPNASRYAYGAGGLIPANHKWSKPYSPLSYYPWDSTYEALINFAKVTDGCAFDGIRMEYVNPTNGKSVLPTTAAFIQMLRPGEHTKAHRHTGNTVYHVAKGEGCTTIDGVKYDWKERDIFCIPTWAVHEHVNASKSDDACLFSYDDSPILKALSLWHEEPFAENDGRQTVLKG